VVTPVAYAVLDDLGVAATTAGRISSRPPDHRQRAAG
jgi:hypothetical protein